MIILEKDSFLESSQTVATIGFFDGVHKGHQFLIDSLIRYAKDENRKSMIITFRNHPQLFLNKSSDIKQLTSIDEKIKKLDTFDLDYCLLLDFSQIAMQKAAEFLSYLKVNFGLETLIVGYDHAFGSDRIKDFDDIKNICNRLNINAIKIERFELSEQKISSSIIRGLINRAEFPRANSFLGYNYIISGMVVEGRKLGRQIGFRTANIDVSDEKLIPPRGVYAVEVIFKNQRYKGMLNIGCRPTVDGCNETIEVNIFDFDEEIYGERVKVEFRKFIRKEQKFDSLQSLINQLNIDKLEVLDFFNA